MPFQPASRSVILILSSHLWLQLIPVIPKPCYHWPINSPEAYFSSTLSTPPHLLCRSPSLLFNYFRIFFPSGKEAGIAADHHPIQCPDYKWVELYFHSHMPLSVHRENFTVLLVFWVVPCLPT
jgi:hypothetical protein